MTAAIALKAPWWVPFLITLVITGYGYLFGLGTYGVGEGDTPDDAGTDSPARSPVSS